MKPTFDLLWFSGWVGFGLIGQVLRWISVHGDSPSRFLRFCFKVSIDLIHSVLGRVGHGRHTWRYPLLRTRSGWNQWRYSRFIFCDSVVDSSLAWSSMSSVESASEVIPEMERALKKIFKRIEINETYVWSFGIQWWLQARLDPLCPPLNPFPWACHVSSFSFHG